VYVASSFVAAPASPSSIFPATWRERGSEPCLSTGFFLRSANSSAPDGCGTVFHCARIASSAWAAAWLVGAATPTNSPSRTAVTPARASAARVSTDMSVAPKLGGRSTRP
jgi:hypothetical protein